MTHVTFARAYQLKENNLKAVFPAYFTTSSKIVGKFMLLLRFWAKITFIICQSIQQKLHHIRDMQKHAWMNCPDFNKNAGLRRRTLRCRGVEAIMRVWYWCNYAGTSDTKIGGPWIITFCQYTTATQQKNMQQMENEKNIQSALLSCLNSYCCPSDMS